MAADASPFAAGDAGVNGERRRFAAPRQFDRRFRAHIPGMIQIEIRSRRCHQRGVGQAVAGVFAGGARDRQRRLHRAADTGLGQIAGGRVALAVAQVDRDAQFTVLLELQALDLAVAHADAEPAARGQAGLGLARPTGARRIERERHPRFQVIGSR